MRQGLSLLLVFIAALGICCPLPAAAAKDEKVKVFVSVVPQRYFVERIGGDRVDVSVMVLPGASPATYEPRPRQMAALSRAKIYFAVGAPFEGAWLAKIAAANPKMRIIHTEQGIPKGPMKQHHHPDSEGHGHKEHGAGEGVLDPHVWLSPPLVMTQARHILDGLVEADRAHAPLYEANYERFTTELEDLDAELRRIFAGKKGTRFMVFHPAWGYFARTYGIEQVPIEVEGKEPRPEQLRHLIELARNQGVRVIFVQPEFSSRSAQVVAREIGGQVAVADPLAADWMTNLRQVAALFRAALW